MWTPHDVVHEVEFGCVHAKKLVKQKHGSKLHVFD
jgi:hypothetical protein